MSNFKTPSLQELLEAGVHFGHQLRRGHPRMKPYIYGAREGVHIIDLTQSEKYLKDACEYVYDLGKDGGSLLFVGTKKQAKPIAEELAKRLGSPYVIERWIGGFFTNYEQVAKNIKRLKELKEQKEKGLLSKYTKKEQLLLDRRMIQLQRDLGGVEDFKGLPDAVFIIDAVNENIAVQESNRMGVKVVAIADTNSDPTFIDYPIPGNDDAIKSIKILSDAIADAYEAGKKQGKDDQDVADAKKAADEAKQSKTESELKLKEDVLEEVAVAEEELEKKALKDAERKTE